MRNYIKKFISEEDGAEVLGMVCILAGVVVLLAAIMTLNQKMEDMSQATKEAAHVKEPGITGYGNVDIR